jgi:hypothetical protein
MIEAAIDARTAFPALVVADTDAGRPPRYVFGGTLELGHVEGRGTLDAKRIATTEDIHAVAQALVGHASMFDVKRIRVEVSERDFSKPLADAIKQEAGFCNIAFEHHAPKPSSTKEISACFDGWPTFVEDRPHGWRVGNFPGIRQCARGLLAEVPIVRVPPKDQKFGEIEIHGTPVGLVKITTPDGAPITITTEGTGTNFKAPRVLAIDPGSHVGVCIAEKVGPTWRCVLSRVVTLDPTKPEQRKDLIAGLARLIRTERVERVVIEESTNFYSGEKDASERTLKAISARATDLLRTNWIGGMVECLALAATPPIPVVTASAQHWRRRVCGDVGKGTPKDAAVAVKVREAFPDWPATTTVHERDAAGLVLWDEMGLPMPATRKRGLSRSKRRQGCTCPPKHRGTHVPTCPLRADQRAPGGKAGGVQKCRVCGLPRKGHKCPGKIAKK